MRLRTRHLLNFTAAGILMLASGCVPAPQPVPTPAPTAPPAPIATPLPAPAPTSTPAPTIRSWQDAPQTIGDWNYRATADGSAAHFGPPNSGALFSMLCRRSTRAMELVRAGQISAAVPLTIRTTNGDGSLTAQPGGPGAPGAVASINASDPLLDAMAFSRGRFSVEVSELQTLYIPAWPEVTRVIEDCR